MPTHIRIRGVPHVFTSYDHLLSFLRSSPGYVSRQRPYLETYWSGALRQAGYAPPKAPTRYGQVPTAHPAREAGSALHAVERAVGGQAHQFKQAVVDIPGIPHRAVQRGFVRSPHDIVHDPFGRREKGAPSSLGPVSGTGGFPSPARVILSAEARALAPAARRALTVGERVQQIPGGSRSPITRTLVAPLEAASQRFPKFPLAGARSRGFKYAGREQGEEIRRARVRANRLKQALPVKDSPGDVAHAVWAQLPEGMRNQAGLRAVRDRFSEELKNVVAAPTEARGKLRQAAQPQRARDLANKIALVDRSISANVKLDPHVIEAMRGLSGARRGILERVGLLDPGKADAREQLFTRWLIGARYEKPTAAKLGKPSQSLIAKRARVARIQALHDRAVEQTQRLEFTGAQAKSLGQLHIPTDLSTEIRVRLPAMEREVRKLTAEHNKPAIDLIAQRASLNRLLRLGNEAQGLVQAFAAKAGRGTDAVAGLGEIQKQADALTEAIRNARGEAPEDLQRLRQRVQKLRATLRQEEAAKSYVVQSEAGHYAVGPKGQVLHPRGFERAQKLGGALSVAKDELVAAESASAKRVKPTGILGGDTTPRGEIFLGHRAETPPAMQRLRSIGTGKPKAPPGTQQNKMELLNSGRIRLSTHVAHEDLLSSLTYEDAMRARNTLTEMGDPVPHVGGEIPETPIPDHVILNPHGKPVPRGWNADELAKMTNGEEIRKAAKDVLRGFIGEDRATWKEIVDQAKASGVADQLRILPKKDVERFYSQFLPVARGTKGGRLYDKLVDATAASLIFGRIGYVPKNVAQNLIMAVPTQGPRLLMNVPRAAQLLPGRPGRSELDRHLWDLLASEVGGGVSGSVSKEATSRALGKPAEVVTGLADTPLRVSALLHQFANEGVIPKWSAHLSEPDKRAILDVFTNEKKRATLNDAMQHARDDMGDFDRLNPTQRRWARRFLIVPGWLMAGTRYPFKFAANRPVTTAALAYAAAGEPGAPKRLQVNKPIGDYLAKGLPSFVKGIGVGGGKVERIQSLFPASLPADIGFALSQGDPLTAASYANPLPESVWLTARSQYESLSGETKNTSFLDALNRNFAGRLAPSAKFVQEEISPPSGQGHLYPDTSRLGRLARETGVLPVKVDPQVAERMRYSERGMTQSVQAAADQQDFFKKLDVAGYEPDKRLRQAYTLRLGRAERLDKIHAHGLPYQQQAYRSDIGYALKLGAINKATATEMLQSLNGASEDEIRHARDEMRDAYFGGTEIRQAKAELQTATAP